MDDIASSVHISKRTLYETFANKEELLTECLKCILDGINDMHRQAHSQAAEPLLMAMYMLRVNADSKHKYQRLLDETERYYPEIHQQLFASHTRKMHSLMQHGMDYLREHHYLRNDANTEVAVDFFCNIMQKHACTEGTDPTKDRQKINEMCFTYLRGLMNVEALERYEEAEPHFQEVISQLGQTQKQK